MKVGRIRHMVIFCLKHDKGSPEEKRFLQDGESMLNLIPGVNNFEVFKQVSSKNDYDFGFSMEFNDKQAYEVYTKHPSHISFLEQRWLKEVDSFLEIDFENI